MTDFFRINRDLSPIDDEIKTAGILMRDVFQLPRQNRQIGPRIELTPQDRRELEVLAGDGRPLSDEALILRLLDRLQSNDTRGHAYHALQQVGAAALPYLVDQLDSSNLRRREVAQEVLRGFGLTAGPALLAEIDNPHSLESRRRANQILDEIGRTLPQDTIVRDSQGRFRRNLNPSRSTVHNVDYDSQGRIHISTEQDSFIPQADGTHLLRFHSDIIDAFTVYNLRVSNDGTIRYNLNRPGAPQVTIEREASGRRQVIYGTDQEMSLPWTRP